jgi:hypothetical protein
MNEISITENNNNNNNNQYNNNNNNNSISSEESKPENTDMIEKISNQGQNFFKKFLWKIFYETRHKTFENLSDKDYLNELITEINKPKLKEIFFGFRKRFEFKDQGKDISVRKNKDFIKLY